jgi:hypothetical protein
LSQLKLRILTSLAVFNKRVLKNCDIKQAFVQSSLPSDEQYFVRPPIGCPRSTPGTYWRLIRSLYGLKQAPKLWYEKLSTHLRSIGMQQSSISPCLFVGTLITGQPPVYVSIYVDDIIYFSASDSVEREFEKQLSSIGNVDFMGQVSHFLGIEFSWRFHPDGILSVSLTQQSFAENRVDSVNYSTASVSSYVSPYRSGLPIDSIPPSALSLRNKISYAYSIYLLSGALIGWPILLDRICPLWCLYSHNINLFLCRVTWMQLYMLLNILHKQKLWAFILAVIGNLHLNLFSTFQFHIPFYLWLMQIGAHRM